MNRNSADNVETSAAAIGRFSSGFELRSDVHGHVRMAVADCFGCILAGADSEVSNRVRRAFDVCGQGTAPIFGTVDTLPGPFAALANAVAGHAYDLDDWEEPGNTHPTVVLLPALLVLAAERKVSGAELARAYIVGFEIIARLGEALSLDHYARGFHSTATLGAIGAAAAGARILNLSKGKTCHAVSIAASQATGYTLQFGSNAKPLQAGFAARTGVEAALLARAGATAQAQILDHPRGFAGQMGQADAANFETVLAKLGAPLAIEEFGLVFKPWPSCGYTHRLMTAALDLRPEVVHRLNDIVAIHAQQPDFHAEILPFHRPRTRNEALFSAPACLAQTLVHGNLSLADGATGFWRDPQVARLIQVTTVRAEPARRPELNYDPGQPDTLAIKLNDRSMLQASCAYPLGSKHRPMCRAQFAEKFQSITGRSAEAFDNLLEWPNTCDVARFFREAAK